MAQVPTIEDIFNKTNAKEWYSDPEALRKNSRIRNGASLSFCKPKTPETSFSICENDMIFSDSTPLANFGTDKMKWERNSKSIIVTLVSFAVIILGDILNSLPIYGFLFDRTVNFVIDLICFAAEFLLFGPFALLSLPKFFAFFTTTPPLITLIIEIFPWNLVVVVLRAIWRSKKISTRKKGVEMVMKRGLEKNIDPTLIYTALYPEKPHILSTLPKPVMQQQMPQRQPVIVQKNKRIH